MAVITEQMFHASYETGRKWYMQSISYAESIRILRDQYKMNPSAADDYLYAYKSMAEGNVLKRVISHAALRFYLTKFFEDQGKVGLQKALSSIQQTIDYRLAVGNISTVGLGRIHKDFLLRV